MYILLANYCLALCHTVYIQLTGIVRLPCKLLMAAWASACPWNFTKAHPAIKHTHTHPCNGKVWLNKSRPYVFFVFYLCWCRRVLSTQYTRLCCQKAQTAFWHPRRSVVYPACQQTTSCPLREQGHTGLQIQISFLINWSHIQCHNCKHSVNKRRYVCWGYTFSLHQGAVLSTEKSHKRGVW